MLASNAENKRCLPIVIAFGPAVRALATSSPYAADWSHRPNGDPIAHSLAFEAQVSR